ncbi:MAG: methyltransferase domain-containing protein, partial [Arenibacterium sp.]
TGSDPGDLKPFAESPPGGMAAPEHWLEKLEITPATRVLDIGAGIGGTARFVHKRFGAHGAAGDLTPSYVQGAKTLNERAGIGDGISVMQGRALDLPLAAGSIDLALMLHVGMNIEDKEALMGEVARVLKPGGHFAIFDVMKDSVDQPLAFPLPWSEVPGNSFVAHPLAYRTAAEGAGLVHESQRARRDFTLAFFARVFEGIKQNGMPPLGIHLLMGESAGEKLQNYVANVEAHRIAPVEMIFRKNG